MKLSDCVVKEEGRNERRRIEAYFPGCVTTSHYEWNCERTEIKEPPTFGKIFEYISNSPHLIEDFKRTYGENYEEVFLNVYITVQTETEGYKWRCNFRDEVFELIEDEEVLSLAEEEKKREKHREEYAVAKKKFRSQQWICFITIVLTSGLWFLMFLLDKNFATQIAPIPLLLIIITAFGMIGAKLRFEDGVWM